MPHRMNEQRTVVTFMTAVRHPYLCRKAAAKRGLSSNTAYYQQIICEALSRDLGIPIEQLLAELPANRQTDPNLFGGTRQIKDARIRE